MALVHQDIGRGDFLAIYVSSGVFGAFSSLTYTALRNNLVHSSLGASGAVAGILAAWCIVHWDEKFTFWILPEEAQKKWLLSGQTLLICFLTLEVLAATVLGTKVTKNDHAAHLGGYAIGILGSLYWKKQHEESQQAQRYRLASRPGLLDKGVGRNV